GKAEFVYPEKRVVAKSRTTTNSYTHPIIRIVFWDRFKTAFNLLKHERYNLILEIGCSYGFALPSLCGISKRVIGTDIEGTFNLCKDLTLLDIQKSHPNLELTAVNVYQLSEVIQPGSCDVILAFSVLEHLSSNHNRALSEIRACLKPEGLFICELPSENWLYRLGRKLIRYHEAHKGYDYAAIRKSLVNSFREVKVVNSPFHIPLFKIGVYQKGLK
ncbi:MAG: class I SAM-dependent methyltransferase, partial [Dehalococcoidia bacterium]